MSRGPASATAGKNYHVFSAEQTVHVTSDSAALHGVDSSDLRAALAGLLGDEYARGPDSRLAAVHLARALEAAGEYEAADALERLMAVSLNRRSSGLFAVEELAEALRNVTDREALRELLYLLAQISERNLDHRETGESRSNFADINVKGPYDGEALSEREGVQGAGHADAMAKRHDLALALVQAGRHGEALREFEGLLTAREQALGSDHPDALATRFDLASLYTQEGRYDEALDQLGEVLAHVEQVEGGTHRDTISVRHSVAYVLSQAGRYSEALHQLEELTLYLVRELGPEHQATLTTRHNFILVLDQAGIYGEALPLLQQLLVDRERVLGAQHDDTLNSRHHLAGILRKTGQYHEALDELQQLLAYFESVLGSEHRNTITVRHDLADLYSELSLHRDERRENRIAIADGERLVGRAGPETGADSHSLDLPPLDDLFEEHEVLVARLIDGDSPGKDEDDVGTSPNAGDAGMEQERLLTRESLKALNADLVALLLRLGPPPETSTTNPHVPVSGGGGTTE